MVPLFKPYMPPDLSELKGILYSGKLAYSNWGPAFENSLATFIGNPLVCALSSYNAAMLVALTTLDLRPGDEIIASPMSCLASNQPLITQHLKVVWADIDPTSGTLCPDSVRKCITSKTKAILHNHYAGYLGYIFDIQKIAQEFGLFVIDDAIEAFGTQFGSRIMGAFEADITIFSFQTVRLPNTIEGGGLAFKENKFYQKARLIRDLGIDRNFFRGADGEINSDYDVSMRGYGALLNEVNSYIGVKQMESLPELLQVQRNNAYQWEAWLNEHMQHCSPVRGISDSSPNYWIYGVLAPDKDVFINTMQAKGYNTSSVHIPNHYYSIFKSRPYLPGVESFYSRFVALPSGWWTDINL